MSTGGAVGDAGPGDSTVGHSTEGHSTEGHSTEGHIVVGVDGSEHSVDALRWAVDEARLRNCTLKVVASFATPIMSTGYEVASPDPSDLAAASTTMLSAAVDSVREAGALEGVDVVTEALEGHAGEQLIRLSEDADLLVVGARGRGGFLGLLMGSVTTYVVNHALCPVVVVRSGERGTTG